MDSQGNCGEEHQGRNNEDLQVTGNESLQGEGNDDLPGEGNDGQTDNHGPSQQGAGEQEDQNNSGIESSFPLQTAVVPEGLLIE